MKTRQLCALFICNLVILTHAQTLGALLPVYATRLGASPALAGYFAAALTLAIVVSVLVAGRLSDTLQHRKATVVVCLALEIPLLWATGQVAQLVPFMLLTIAMWLVGALGVTTVTIIAGLFAGPMERGRVFGILGAATGLGALIGGLSVGSIVDRWGYSALFPALMLWYICFLPAVVFFLEDKVVVAAPKEEAAHAAPSFGGGFYLLLVSVATGTMASSMGLLGRSLGMRQQGFAASDLLATVVAIGVVTLVLSPLLGRLSDRMGRRSLLALGYVLGSAGLWLFSTATTLGQFIVAAGLLAMIGIVTASIGQAFVADLVPLEGLARGISRYNAVLWMGGAAGSAVMGNIIAGLGMHGAFLLAALLPLVAIVAVLRVQPRPRESVVAATGVPAAAAASPRDQ